MKKIRAGVFPYFSLQSEINSIKTINLGPIWQQQDSNNT